MKKAFYIAFLLCITSLLYAQNTERLYINAQIHDAHLIVNTSDGVYHFKTYNDQVSETSFIPTGEMFDPNSHAVVAKKKLDHFNFIERNDTIHYSTNGISVVIVKEPFQILYTYKNNSLISEKRGYIKTDTTEVLEFNLDKNEVLYGGGARALGMNRRGNRLELYNKAHYGYETRSELLNYTLPLVASSKKYLLHFDNAPIGFVDLDSKKNNTLQYETISGRKTYQLIAGSDWPSILNNYTDLTGKQPMPPRWALGNFASRFGYHSQSEVETVVSKFKKDSIPLDAVVLDIYWFGKNIKGHMGNLEFLTDSFPRPKKMINDFRKKGIKTILVTEPYVLSTSKKWKEAVEKTVLATKAKGEAYQYDFYFGNTGLIDIFKPEGKQWFWDIYKKYTHIGIAGWWGDLGEPEVHPSDLQHATGSANEVHNIYGHQWASLLHEGYQKDFPNQRPFILMRSGAAGSQRFGMIPWSGDVNRSWGGLKVQPEIALQMGMQGLGYMHSDLGGFAGGKTFDAELYTRWLQYGVFQPIFRPHAQEHIAPEPVFHDDITKAVAKKAIELRYQLLPYNYTLAYENHTKGLPLMRPLLFFEPDNTTVFENDKTYLWGNDFLVSPITEAGVTQQEIYFPKGSNWIDFYTKKVYEGGKTYGVSVVIDHIPLFVRSGAFIPMAKLIQTTDDYDLANFYLHYYYKGEGATTKSQLYHDDGKTPKAFEKGKYELLSFEAESDKRGTILKLSKKIGQNFESKDKKMKLIVHNLNTKPSKLKLDGKKVEFSWNNEKKHLTVPIFWEANKEFIKVELL